ncbi:plasmalemma vesicle associated protein a isoform X1 [Thunnus thynnus]|uniref:plasmalemma vesicle associated protein a isoform X1 n=1 Tax=Thunnus thynnus TaxID=8237 RepID=UPI0035296DF8
MYSSGYSQVSKYSPQAQKKMQYRSKGKSCGYYMRIVFFFSSLIQSLIIVSLVLFLVYGKKQDSASTTRIQDLEESFSRLSIENVALRQQRKNLTNFLNTSLTEKTRIEWDLVKFRHFSNISMYLIEDLNKKLQQCSLSLMSCKNTQITGSVGCTPPHGRQMPVSFVLPSDTLNARLQLLESNFTQTMQRMRMERDQIAKDRDNINLEAIRLRRDKSTCERELQVYRLKCKEDFIQSLSGVSNVSKAFLQKIESLFPTHIAFQLTCQNQRDHLEQIRTNCTSLSREVEDKFQRYLNSVGEQVSAIQAENSRLKAENWRLSEDYRWCSQNRSGLIQEHRQNFEKFQLKHDKDKEKLLMDKMTLHGEIEVLQKKVNFKNKEVEHLTQQIKQLNMSCMFKPGGGSIPGIGQPSQAGAWNTFNGGSSSASSSSSGVGQLGRAGFGVGYGSSGTGFNKPGSTGLGSSSFGSTGSSPNLSSTGSGLNKPGSTGLGSSSYGSARSSPSLSSVGSGFNKPGSTGLGSSSYGSTGSSPNLSSAGSGFNKPVSTGLGSSSYGSTGSSPNLSLNKPATSGRNTPSFASSSGSTGSSPNLGSGGSGLNKPGSTGLGSSSYGSTGSSPNLSSGGIGSNKPTSSVKSSPGLGSTGSASKSGSASSGLSWFGLGLGNSNTGQSKPGSGTGKGTSSGTGSLFGGGRTSGLGGGPVSVTQHLQDLQRIINPPGPEEKQDLSRMLG